MKNWRRNVIFVSLIIIIAIAIFFWQNRYQATQEKIPTADVQHGLFKITLQATGVMQAIRSQPVSARGWWGMTIGELVEEGEYVKEGDFLVKLTHSDTESRLEESQSELEAAQQRYEQALAEYQLEELQLALDLKKAERDLQIAKLEAKEKQLSNISEAEKESAAKTLEVAEAEYDFAKESYDIKVTQSKSKLEEAKYELEQAEKEVNRYQKRIESMTIHSPGEGIVVYAENWEGEKITKGMGGVHNGMKLIELPDLSEMKVEAEVNEIEIGEVKKGQKAIVKLDAFPELEFTGEITDISTLAKESKSKSGTQVFIVTVLLDGVDEKMKPGMTASVEILIDQIPNVIYIPQEAVFEKEDTTVVYMKDGLSHRKQVVALGKSNENYIIVKNGLDESDAVFLRDPTIQLDDVGMAEDGNNHQK